MATRGMTENRRDLLLFAGLAVLFVVVFATMMAWLYARTRRFGTWETSA